jgi:6-phosphogluconolactonase (cycloisomerase 2 family)
MKYLLSLLAIFICTTVFSQTYVFFGSFNHDKETKGIYIYKLDTIKGKLEKVITFKGVLNPSYLTLSPDGKYIYSCTESKTPGAGSVSSFAFDREKKSLTYLNSQKSGGENPVYLTTDDTGKWLINGNYTEGGVSVYPIAKDGSIKPAVQHFQYTEGSNFRTNRQDRAHIHSTIFSPDYKYIYFIDLGADKICCYRFDSKSGKPLTEEPSIATDPGSGPRHLTFHPNGKFAYCIEELSGTVSVYNYDNGKLENIQNIATHPKEITEGFESSDIHISPDGKFLYASNRGNENNIVIFSINGNGQLKNIGYQATFGLHPRTFAIDPSGKFIIVTNVNSNNAVVFKRDLKTGLLKKNSEVEIPHVSCVKIKNYNNVETN